jgi:hypothetical protein
MLALLHLELFAKRTTNNQFYIANYSCGTCALTNLIDTKQIPGLTIYLRVRCSGTTGRQSQGAIGGGGSDTRLAREYLCTRRISALSSILSLANLTPPTPGLSLERDNNTRCASLARLQAHLNPGTFVSAAAFQWGSKRPQTNQSLM